VIYTKGVICLLSGTNFSCIRADLNWRLDPHLEIIIMDFPDE